MDFVCVLRNLKEELACAIDKWLRIININNILLLKTIVIYH